MNHNLVSVPIYDALMEDHELEVGLDNKNDIESTEESIDLVPNELRAVPQQMPGPDSPPPILLEPGTQKNAPVAAPSEQDSEARYPDGPKPNEQVIEDFHMAVMIFAHAADLSQISTLHFERYYRGQPLRVSETSRRTWMLYGSAPVATCHC